MRKDFSQKVKMQAWVRAKGRCEECDAKLSVGTYAYDHVIPDGLTGEPSLDNCMVLCFVCHREKTRGDVGRIAKAKRIEAKHLGAHTSRKPLPFGKRSPWRKKLDGTVVRRES